MVANYFRDSIHFINSVNIYRLKTYRGLILGSSTVPLSLGEATSTSTMGNANGFWLEVMAIHDHSRSLIPGCHRSRSLRCFLWFGTAAPAAFAASRVIKNDSTQSRTDQRPTKKLAILLQRRRNSHHKCAGERPTNRTVNALNELIF